MIPSIQRAAGMFLALSLTVVLAARDARAQRSQFPGPSDAAGRLSTSPSAARKPTDFKSAHFLIHTDLSANEAHDLLKRLETMLGLIAKYWNHPPVGTIECYVVKDLAAWPEGSLPDEGRRKIEENAGITVVETLSRGAKTVSAKAIVYAKYGADPRERGDAAAADRGTPQHEAVHAYCGQVFGHTGPLWYAEGMAEMGRYWRQGDTSVLCDPIVAEYLHSNPPKPLAEILSDRAARTGDSWQDYAWRWALCHMLENNPNYSARFRGLGLGLLAGQPVSFADTYGGMLAELAFEYRFFLRHLDEGYRVDLCSWDWKRKFREPGDSPIITRVAAQHGWQPSGVIVAANHYYGYTASGGWHTSKTSDEVTADGRVDGAGRLEGIVLDDFVLSAALPLGAQGSFRSPCGGQLYLRCRDKWNELADNRGTISVKIKLNRETPSPPRPSESAAE